MMKSWSRLCFLVLAVSSLSRGQNETSTVPPKNGEHNNGTDSAETSMPEPGNRSGTNQSEPLIPPPQNGTNQTGPSTTAFTVTAATDRRNQTGTTVIAGVENNGSAAARTTTPGAVPGIGGEGDDDGEDVTTTVSTETTSSSVIIEGKDQSPDHSSWGYVILVLIILVIIALCVILYVLRRVSRTYSFDLQRPVPVSSEPTGTFEPVYLDDLDRPAPIDQTTPDDLSPPPVSNGTTLPSEEKSSSAENGTTSDAPQEQPDANGLETGDTSPSLGDEPADKTSSPLSSANLFFDTIGEEQQNENNNNPSVCSSDPFVEINLDDPAWCDQLLTSPEAPSSVLPFSPFSFSSSS